MARHSVLVGFAIHPAAIERLAQEVEVLGDRPLPEAEYRELLARADGVVLSARPFGVDEIRQAQRLAVIGRYGVGVDNIDIAAATEHGLPVVYTPFGPMESTAELAFLLILAVARRLPFFDRAVRSSQWGLQTRPELMGRELEGKALGVVGFGRIGRRVAEMCRAALNMSVCVYDPWQDAGAIADWGATPYTDLIEMVSQVDIVTIHAPYTPATRHLINRTVLHAMKSGAILVNTSRGPVVDEGALIEALQSGHLMGAGLDVFDPEPPSPDNPLLQMDNVVLTPHIGSFTEEGRRRMALTVAEEVLRVLRGERPLYLVNPEVWERRRQPL